MKHKRAYCACMVIVTVMLLFSNQIVSSFFEDRFVEVGEPLKTFSKDLVLYAIDYFDSDHGSLLEQISIHGWAFCKTERDNDDKEVAIVITNPRHSYSYRPLLMIRSDIRHAFPFASGDRHAFLCGISTIPVANGVYDVYIYCKENEENYGIVQTEFSLIKNGVRTELRAYLPVDLPEQQRSAALEDARVNVDKDETQKDGTREIAGWAFVPGVEAAQQRVYLCLEREDGTDACFRAKQTYRPDVAAVFGEARYEMSGFYAKLPADALEAKGGALSVCVEVDGVLHRAAQQPTEVAAEAPDLSQAQADALVCIDHCEKDGDGTLNIAGWAYVPNQETEGQKVFVRLNGGDGQTQVRQANTIQRDDVAAHFDNALYRASGFQTSVESAQLPPPPYELTVVVENETGVHVSPVQKR